MKMTKRIFSLALCLVLMLALALPAMAAGETYTLTIDNATDGHIYEAYQIFSGDLATNDAGKTVLSSIQWGNGIGIFHDNADKGDSGFHGVLLLMGAKKAVSK